VVVAQGGDAKVLVFFGVFSVPDSKTPDIEQAHPDGGDSPFSETATIQIPIHDLS
jgi:hypothetical protein